MCVFSHDIGAVGGHANTFLLKDKTTTVKDYSRRYSRRK